ncbi:MAG: FecR domain-containing protein, partial [Hyphococcus sp.]
MATAASAQNGDWRVVEMTGVARAAQPMSGVQQISTGNALGAGAVVTTGMNGRVVLVRGEQQIVVGPSSRMSLPATEEPGKTRILQDLGTLLFKVDKRDKQHFRVETPIIAAVVKGTTFTVTAGPDAHAVHVAEGAVEVAALSGTARQLVTPGVTAFISRAEPTVIRLGAASGDSVRAVPGQNYEKRNDRSANDGQKKTLFVPTEIGGAPL